MSLNYSQLQARITDYLIGDTDSSAEITAALPSFIDQAEQRLSRELVVPALAFYENLATSNAQAEFSYPADAVILRSVQLVGGKTLELRTYEFIKALQGTSTAGEPVYYATYGADKFMVFPPSDGAADLSVSFHKRIPALETAGTNWFGDNVPDLLLAACMVNAELYNKAPDQAAVWDAKYSQLLASAQAESRGFEIDRTAGSNP